VSKRHFWLIGPCCLFLSVTARLGAEPGAVRSQDLPAPASSAPDPQLLSAKIDQLIGVQLSAKGVKPAGLADDAEFVRRVYLDLVGRIPRAFEVRDFLDDDTRDKRQRLMESLLDSPSYVNHFTNVWRHVLLPASNNQEVQFLLPGFEAWLRQRIRENAPYDQIVREVLTTSVGPNLRSGAQRFDSAGATPVAFYQANDLKAENLAASTSRLFLGIRLECAQCHDHPHANIGANTIWERNQFWEYAAFFYDIQPEGFGAARDLPSIKIPGTERVVQARFLDGNEPRWLPGLQARSTLATWMTAKGNPYFARAAANRLWAHFFGIGLVEPVDDLSEQNPPSHPELLQELADQLVGSGYDQKFLIRAITCSQAYQRTSATAPGSQTDPRAFARMAVRGLTPEQLFDSLAQATGYRDKTSGEMSPFPGANSPRGLFLARFANQDKRTEFQTSILQALALMNGKFIDDATSIEQSETLAAVVDAPFLDAPQRIETLYLAVLSRKPRADEAARFEKYVSAGGPKHDSKAALGDVFWALLNSAEFMLNH
jgi:hypothetical protein